MITFEEFNEQFLDLSMNERLSVYNKYCIEFDADDRIEENEAYNLDDYFEDVIDALRAAEYGEYSVTDEYFKINAYGNLVSFGDLDVMGYINEKLDDIYEHPEFWKDYIDPDHTEDDEDGEGE